MKWTFLRCLILIFFVSLINMNCASTTAELQGTLGANRQLSGIQAMLKNAGGLKSLIGNGNHPFTFLAPTNTSLATLGTTTVDNLLKPENKVQLQELLKKHVLSGKFNKDQIKKGGLKVASGNELNLGNAHIIETIQTKGGLIHVIDKVLN